MALASTMVFGEALPAMAADGSADVQSAQAEVAFAEEASITYFSVGGQDTVSSGSVHISALGYGTEAVLYVNGAWYDSWTGSDYDGSFAYQYIIHREDTKGCFPLVDKVSWNVCRL